MAHVSVRVAYFGSFLDKTGVAEERVDLDECLELAYPELVRHLSERHGLAPPYSVLVNRRHIIGAMKAGWRLKDGDTITLLPFMSGG